MQQSYTNYKIPLDKVEVSIGKGFTLSNNQILIGDNINAIRVSGNLNIWTGPNTMESICRIAVLRGSSTINIKESNAAKNGLLDLCISSHIVEVQKGDIVIMQTATSTTGTFVFIGRSTNTYLTVEKIY